MTHLRIPSLLIPVRVTCLQESHGVGLAVTYPSSLPFIACRAPLWLRTSLRLGHQALGDQGWSCLSGCPCPGAQEGDIARVHLAAHHAAPAIPGTLLPAMASVWYLTWRPQSSPVVNALLRAGGPPPRAPFHAQARALAPAFAGPTLLCTACAAPAAAPAGSSSRAAALGQLPCGSPPSSL